MSRPLTVGDVQKMTYEEFRQVMIAHYRKLRDDALRPPEEREYYRIVVERAEAELAARQRVTQKSRKRVTTKQPRSTTKRKPVVAA